MLSPFPAGFFQQTIPEKLLHLNMDCDVLGKNVVQLGNFNIQTQPDEDLFGGPGFVYYAADDFVNVYPRDEFFPTCQSWTVDMWFFNPGSLPATCFFFTFNQPDNDYYNYTQCGLDGGNVVLRTVRNSSEVGRIESSGYSIPAGWMHLACTYDSETGVYTVYVNGVSVATGLFDEPGFYGRYGCQITVGNNAGWAQSASYPNQAPYGFPTPAMIKAFRMSGEVLWSAPFTPPYPPYTPDDNTRVLMYGFGDATNRHSIFTTTSSNTYGGIQINPHVKKWGSALELNRSYLNYSWYNSIHTEGSADFLFASDFAVEMWVNMKIFSGNQWVWNVNNTELGLYFASSTLRACVNGSYFIVNAPTFSVNKWYHTALIRGLDDVVRCAIDGTFVTNNISYAPDLGANSNFVIGAAAPSSTTETANMYVDEVVVWPENVYPGDFTPRTRPW
jgi:hypothetical protein